MVTGGGLALDADRWVDSGGKYLFPVKVISALFRGKFIALLKKAHHRGSLDLGPERSLCPDFPALCNALFKKPWVVYAKRPFAGPEQVFAYLGRYTHRVAISNHRLQAVTDETVTFATRDGKSASLHPNEFIRRFLLHVLPKGLCKIRHYGLLASTNVKSKLPIARTALKPRNTLSNNVDGVHDSPTDWKQRLKDLTGVDLTVCPVCGNSNLRRVPLAAPREPLPMPPATRVPP